MTNHPCSIFTFDGWPDEELAAFGPKLTRALFDPALGDRLPGFGFPPEILAKLRPDLSAPPVSKSDTP